MSKQSTRSVLGILGLTLMAAACDGLLGIESPTLEDGGSDSRAFFAPDTGPSGRDGGVGHDDATTSGGDADATAPAPHPKDATRPVDAKDGSCGVCADAVVGLDALHVVDAGKKRDAGSSTGPDSGTGQGASCFQSATCDHGTTSPTTCCSLLAVVPEAGTCVTGSSCPNNEFERCASANDCSSTDVCCVLVDQSYGVCVTSDTCTGLNEDNPPHYQMCNVSEGACGNNQCVPEVCSVGGGASLTVTVCSGVEEPCSAGCKPACAGSESCCGNVDGGGSCQPTCAF